MSYFFTILYIMMIFIRPQEYVEAIKGWPLQYVAAILCIASIFLEGAFSFEKLKRSPAVWLLVVFWLWISATWVFNGWAGGLWFNFLNFMPVALTFFLIILTVDSFSKLRIMAWVLVSMALFLAIQAIIQYNTGQGLGGVTALQTNYDAGMVRVRGVGLYADPNDMAINMVPFAALLLPAFHRNFMSRSWVPGILALIPLAVGIAFTTSRGAFLGLLAVGWFYMYKRVGKTLSLVGAGLLLLVILAAPRMGELNTQEDSARARLDHWSYGLALLRQNPVAGVGMGGFTEDYYRTAHNSFILVIAECGLVGGLLWVAIFLAAYRDIRLTRVLSRAPPWLDPALNALQGAIIGWLVCAMFLSQTYKFTSFILVAMVVAVLNALAKEGYEVRHPWTARMSMATLGVTIGGIIFMHIALKVLWAL